MDTFKIKISSFWKIILSAFIIVNILSPFTSRKIEASGTYYEAQGTYDRNKTYGTFYINGVHSQIAYITIDNIPALCVEQNAYGVDHTYRRGNQVTDSKLKRALNLAASISNIQELYYQAAQGFIWGYLAGKDEEAIIDDMVEVVNAYFGGKFLYDRTVSKDIYDIIVEKNPNRADLSNGTAYYWITSVGQNVISLATGTPVTYDAPKYETVSSEKTANEEVTIQLLKKDENTNQPLGDVTFDFYRDDVKIATSTTNENGIASASYNEEHIGKATATYCVNYAQLEASDKNAIDSNSTIYNSKESAQNAANSQAQANADAIVANQKHTYKAVEVLTKNEYWLNNTAASDEITGNGTVTLELTNKHQTGNIEIIKYDEETNKTVSGSIYKLYAAENIYHPDEKTGLVHAKDTLVETFPTTGNDGKSILKELYLGKYYILEETAPNGYTLSNKRYDVTLAYAGQTIEVTSVSEIVTNKVQRAKIIGVKKDKELNTSQGDATLKNALYGLYARNDIIHKDGKTGIISYNQNKGSIFEITSSLGSNLHVENTQAKANTLLATIRTDENGKFSFENLHLGKYFIKEIEPSEGYLLDSTEYDVSLDYAGQNVEITTQNITTFEQVKKQAFDLYKCGNIQGSSDSKPLGNIHFEVKLESDIQKLVNEGNTIDEAKKLAPLYDELITKTDGTASSIELPYGIYRVMETVTSPNYSYADDFFITVSEDNRVHQSWTNNVIVNQLFSAYIQAVKVDKETGKTILLANTEFKIKALSDVYVNGKEFKAGEYIGYFSWNPLKGFWQDSWKTDETGMVMLNELLGVGEYQLEEIKAPTGYILDTTPVKFTISNDKMMETAPDGHAIMKVYKEDTPTKGYITIEKRGDVLVDYKNEQFIYEERGLADVHFNIIAKENILDPSNDKTILYERGEIIEEIVTNNDGKATSSQLPLGKYEVVEKSTIHGFVFNDEKQEVELKYVNENTTLVFKGISFKNVRQKVNAQIIKIDNEIKTIGLKDAEFDFITKEDILNADEKVIVKAGTILEHVISDEKGMISITKDLPLDIDFKLVETKSPVGYELDETPIEFNTNYQEQDVQTIIIEKTKENKRTKVDFSKTDITTEKELAGNHMMIFEKGNPNTVFTTWVSEDTPHTVEFLSTDIRYVLRETSTVNGFYLANDIEFELDQYGNTYIFDEKGNKLEAKDNLIKMENDVVKGKLVWDKIGEIFTHTDLGQTEFGQVHEPVWETSNLLQNEITIYAAEDITLGNGITYFKKDEVIQTLESDWESVYSQELLVGKYYYMETKTAHGYIQDTEKHYFEIKDNQSSELQLIESTLWNNRPTVEIEFTKFMEPFKYHNSLDDAYKDVVFGIYAREDIYTYMGTIGIEHDTLIATSGIDELGQLDHLPDLPNGTYYLKELQTNPSYVLDEKEYDFEISYHGQDVASYKIMIGENGTIENKIIRGSVEIQKHDTLDETKLLENVKFNISAYSDMSYVFATAITDENGIANFENLEIGKYYIQEAKQEDGYVLNDTIYEVEVKENGKILTIEINNTPTEMYFSKVDETGKNELAGAKMSLTDKLTGEVLAEWISTNTPYVINYLVEGREYVLNEVTAPYGYEIAESITFVAGDGDTITMKDELIYASFHINKTDSQTNKIILNKAFEFTRYADSKCENRIETITGNIMNGHASFNIPYGTWYFKETKAPSGYELSDEIVKVTLNNEGLFINDHLIDKENDYYSISYNNSPLPDTPQTSDRQLIILYLFTAILSFLALITYFFKKTKEITE